jgi:hypothetical protein
MLRYYYTLLKVALKHQIKLLALSVPDEDYSRNMSCTLNLISTFLLPVFQLFSYIIATSFSGGRSRSIRREPPTMGKQLVNFITCGCESSAPFYVIYKAGREPTPYWLKFLEAANTIFIVWYTLYVGLRSGWNLLFVSCISWLSTSKWTFSSRWIPRCNNSLALRSFPLYTYVYFNE